MEYSIMKTARVINGIVWAVVTIGIMAMVVAEWHAQGCGVKSLLLAGVFYTSMGVAFWFGVDQCIQGK